MARLQLTFFSGDEIGKTPRILDTAEHETGKEWVIGRTGEFSVPDIVFHDRFISRQHAIIRCLTQYDREQWQIKHVGRNGSDRVSAGGHLIPLAFEKWENMIPDDRFVFGRDKERFPTEGFISTTTIDETLQGLELPEQEEEESTQSGSDLINNSPQAVVEQMKEQRDAAGRTWADVAHTVLNGPPNVPSQLVWVWWGLVGAGVVHLAATWIRHR